MTAARPLAWLFACFLALALAAGLALADCPSRAVVRQPYCAPPAVVVVGKPYVAPAVVVKKAVVVEEVPVVVRFSAVIPLVDYGSYSAVYAPPPAVPAAQQGVPQASAAPQQAPQQDMAKVLQALDGIGKRLDALEKGRAPAAAPQKAQPEQPQPEQQVTALAVVQAKCASCHSDKAAADKGGGLVLLADGALADLSARQRNKVLGRSYAGTMPPKDSGVAPLSDAEVGALVSAYAK